MSLGVVAREQLSPNNIAYFDAVKGGVDAANSPLKKSLRRLGLNEVKPRMAENRGFAAPGPSHPSLATCFSTGC